MQFGNNAIMQLEILGPHEELDNKTCDQKYSHTAGWEEKFVATKPNANKSCGNKAKCE